MARLPMKVRRVFFHMHAGARMNCSGQDGGGGKANPFGKDSVQKRRLIIFGVWRESKAAPGIECRRQHLYDSN